MPLQALKCPPQLTGQGQERTSCRKVGGRDLVVPGAICRVSSWLPASRTAAHSTLAQSPWTCDLMGV